MEPESLDCVITSPPYWQLRDYGYDGQWGLEPTYQEYLEHLWQMMTEVYRVLKPMGTVWVNLGDTYSRGLRSKDGTNHTVSKRSKEHHVEPNKKPNYQGSDKCLLLLPHRFAIGCIDRGWIVRNDIIWAKRNGMPESVTDRFSKKHEYFFFMVKQEKYYFNLDAVRDKHIWGDKDKRADGKRHESKGLCQSKQYATNAVVYHENGKNPGSVSDFWDIPTRPSSEKHYAMYNDALLLKPILAGCPEGGIIYDPFAGAGSTLEAGLRARRHVMGSEMSKEFCDIAQKRIDVILNQNHLL
jgi:site-specific DNA-methyltransferase (adenine-specific)